MATGICVNVINLYLVKQNQTVDQCTTFILQSKDEYVQNLAITALIQIPDVTTLTQMFQLGFNLPLLAYLAAWSYNAVISFFNK